MYNATPPPPPPLQIRKSRDADSVQRALRSITDAAREQDGDARHNLLAAAVEAARSRATVGEITEAMGKVGGGG